VSRPEADYRDELFLPGHLGCPGCGSALGLRFALEALGPRTVLVMGACCADIVIGLFPKSNLRVPVLDSVFAAAAVTAAGVRASLDMQGQEGVTVMAWSGDGGTFDIGLQSLSGAAERNENIIYICYDNEAYMNTGIQRSSATPAGAWTTTTPDLKDRPKKDMVRIMAAHRIPYAATASVAFPEDFKAKLAKAREITGMRFIHLHSPCPPGWRIPSAKAVKTARLAVWTNLFPLYEVEGGRTYRITVPTRNKPLGDYLGLQGRFQDLSPEQIAALQASVDEDWERLNRRAAESAGQEG